MNWNELFEQYLLNPKQAEEYLPEAKDLFCISILFIPQNWKDTTLSSLSENRLKKATIIHNAPKPIAMKGHDFGVQLFYSNPRHCLMVALKLIQKFAHQLRISIS